MSFYPSDFFFESSFPSFRWFLSRDDPPIPSPLPAALALSFKAGSYTSGLPLVFRPPAGQKGLAALLSF